MNSVKVIPRFKIVALMTIITTVLVAQSRAYDLSLVGVLKQGGSLTRVPIILMDMLKDDLEINFISSEPHVPIDLKDTSADVKRITLNPDKTPGNVALLVDHLWYVWTTPSAYMPQSKIKLALSMIESTEIPKKWVDILNNQFDAVIVPDPYFIDVYSACNVKIPIFCLPLGLLLDDFFAIPPRKVPQKPFTFGMSAYFCSAKNQESLIKAFIQEFGNDRNFKLKLHGRAGASEPLKNLVKKAGANNIELIDENFTQSRYLNFFSSLDCYVLPSKGEGFSLTPREALALGIPCILTKNTAHITICNSGFVKAINSSLLEPADYNREFGAFCGYKFNCEIDDLRKALREVYENYSDYKDKALQGREWAKQYDYRNLRSKYRALAKPKKVIFGNINAIEDDCIRTNDKKLYDKYYSFLEKS